MGIGSLTFLTQAPPLPPPLPSPLSNERPHLKQPCVVALKARVHGALLSGELLHHVTRWHVPADCVEWRGSGGREGAGEV